VTYLDTHALIWLNPGEAAGLSDRARRAIDADDQLLLSPVVLLELENLHEIRRFRHSAKDWMVNIGSYFGIQVCSYPFGLVMDQALREKWTRDPFDRIIVAHARARKAPLITSDRAILRHYDLAVW
jgi:PIN domain nuclease of toxin-antitoxin system